MILLIFALSMSLTAQDYVAITLKSEGQVSLKRGAEKFTLKTGAKLKNKDELISKEDSYAAIKFIDGSSVVKLFPNSILQITAQQEDERLNKKSFLEMGDLWTEVKKKTGIFEVETPTTVVSVKGTEFVVNVADKGATMVHSLSGEVSVKSKFDDEEVSLLAGKTAIAAVDEAMKVRETQRNDIPENIKRETSEKNIRIELQNEAGEKKIINIEYED